MLGNAKASATLPVVDMDRARKFYGETLGLRETPLDVQGHAKFEAGGGSSVIIYQRAPTKADNTAVEFWVDDLEAEMAELRSKGVTFEEYDFPGLKTEHGVALLGNSKGAWFKDTEGNILAISSKA